MRMSATVKHVLNAENIKKLLDYDPLTGLFTWRWRDKKYFPADRYWRIWNKRRAVTYSAGDGSQTGH
jgi:hypothetical protein